MRIPLLLTTLTLWALACFAQTEQRPATSIGFRHGSPTLYRAYHANATALDEAKQLPPQHQAPLAAGQGQLQIVSVIPATEQHNPVAINLAATRAAMVRQWLCNHHPWLTHAQFAFLISPQGSRNAVEVSFINTPIASEQQSHLYFTLDPRNPLAIESALGRYARIPFADSGMAYQPTAPNFAIIDPNLDPTATQRIEGALDEQVLLTIYYRVNKDFIDRTYLANGATLHSIDSLLRLPSSEYIDTLRITAYASPEGPTANNQRLSQRRAESLRTYIRQQHPKFSNKPIIAQGFGENWPGMRRMVAADPHTPQRDKVLWIIDNIPAEINYTTNTSRKKAIMDLGTVPWSYMLKNHFPKLRTGASLFVVYSPGMPVDIDFEPISVVVTEPAPEPPPIPEPEPEPIRWDTLVIHPLALRTNLLYDAVGAANIGFEVPFGKRKNWSWIVDAAYAHWRSANNLYALQTLEYGTELRHWFPVSAPLKARHPHWVQPLKGLYVGAYGSYHQRYDVQWTNGYQGDQSWGAGLTAGYAIALNRHLALDLGAGAGWFSTAQYRHYHQPQYNSQGQYHLMWQETGSWSGLSLTKLRISLVWLLHRTTLKKGDNQ